MAIIFFVELIGFVLSYFKWSNNLVYIFFDFLITNLVLFYYISNIYKIKDKFVYYLIFILNSVIFCLCFLTFKDVNDFDFTYTLIYTFCILSFGLILYWRHLGIHLKKYEVISINFLFIYNILMSLVNKFIIYYSYFENPFYIIVAHNFAFIYNIFGFGFTIKLFLNKNEN